jgi:hypothetical protein
VFYCSFCRNWIKGVVWAITPSPFLPLCIHSQLVNIVVSWWLSLFGQPPTTGASLQAACLLARQAACGINMWCGYNSCRFNNYEPMNLLALYICSKFQVVKHCINPIYGNLLQASTQHFSCWIFILLFFVCQVVCIIKL